MNVPLWEPALVAKPKCPTTLFFCPSSTGGASQRILPGTSCDVFETSEAEWVAVRVRAGADVGQIGYAQRHHFGALRLPHRLPPLPWRLAVKHAPRAKIAPLFNATSRPHPHDIRQGLLGDCAVLAAFSAVARRYPDFLKQVFCNVRLEEKVDVRYFAEQKGGFLLQQTLSVSSRILRASSPFENTSLTARARGRGENHASWPAILEKAYALSTGDGSYRRIDGHDAKHVFLWLLGCGAETFKFRHRWRDATANLSELAGRYAQGECLVVYSAGHAYDVIGFVGVGRNQRCLLYSSQGRWPGAHGSYVVTCGRTQFARKILAFTSTYGASDVAGRPHGKGTMVFANGNRYEGDRDDGKSRGEKLSRVVSALKKLFLNQE